MHSVPHWVILKYSSIHVAGDERSRTHPGHGYPSHSVDNVSYEAYLTEEKFLEAVQELTSHSGRYSVFKVEPLTIKTTLSVTAE